VSCLVVGAGAGLGAAFARVFTREGLAVALAARDPAKLREVCKETGATAFSCDATREADVIELFESVQERLGVPRLVIYTASARVRGPIADLDAAAVQQALTVTAFGGFLVAREAARRMLDRGGGAIFFTGASASVKGYAQSASFAMGKFALRGLAQSMARELQPQGIHVAHTIIDGQIEADRPGRNQAERGADAVLDPGAIAEAYYQLHLQAPSAWTLELDLRPYVEKF